MENPSLPPASESLAMTRLYIVDDHPYMLEVLREYLERQPDFEVCGEALTGREAIDNLLLTPAEIALVDLSLPDMSGIELIRELIEQLPELRIAVVSGHKSEGHVRAALEAGAHGYILKDNTRELPEAIRSILAGERYLSSAVKGFGAT